MEQLQQIDLNVFEDDSCASYTNNNGVDDHNVSHVDYKRIHDRTYDER